MLLTLYIYIYIERERERERNRYIDKIKIMGEKVVMISGYWQKLLTVTTSANRLYG
jgi:preprotein translocase subunit YajC